MKFEYATSAELKAKAEAIFGCKQSPLSYMIKPNGSVKLNDSEPRKLSSFLKRKD